MSEMKIKFALMGGTGARRLRRHSTGSGGSSSEDEAHEAAASSGSEADSIHESDESSDDSDIEEAANAVRAEEKEIDVDGDGGSQSSDGFGTSSAYSTASGGDHEFDGNKSSLLNDTGDSTRSLKGQGSGTGTGKEEEDEDEEVAAMLREMDAETRLNTMKNATAGALVEERNIKDDDGAAHSPLVRSPTMGPAVAPEVEVEGRLLDGSAMETDMAHSSFESFDPRDMGPQIHQNQDDKRARDGDSVGT